MNGPATGRRKRRESKLPDLVMGKAEVCRGADRELGEEAGGHCRLEDLRQRFDLVSCFAEASFDIVEVAEAKGAAKDGCFGEGCVRILAEAGGATLDEGPHSGR